MSVKLRLTRTGKTKKPSYRIVAADSRAPRNGRFLEVIGTYDPLANPQPIIRISKDKALKWLKNGAKPTETVERLFKVDGLWQEFKKG
jgi:small subunit ribosomal protein S16